MKRRGLVLFFVGVVLFGVCSVQMANAQNTNNAQKIIGTWVEQNGTTWVFNADGTMNGYMGNDDVAKKFGVTDTKLVILRKNKLKIFDISISPDGKTLIIVGDIDTYQTNSGLLSYFGRDIYWLTKK